MGPIRTNFFICRKHKIVFPKLLGKQVVEWYHNALCHPGETCTELSIAQHFYWKNLHKIVIPISLEKQVVIWYQNSLCTELSIY